MQVTSGGPILGKNGGSCFPGSGLVQTPNGPKLMEDLQIGDKVARLSRFRQCTEGSCHAQLLSMEEWKRMLEGANSVPCLVRQTEQTLEMPMRDV